MSAKKYSLAVVIGRFQPFHDGHHMLIDKAFDIADNVLILVGSVNAAITVKDPWTYSERKLMIFNTLFDDYGLDFDIAPLKDYTDDLDWKVAIGDEIARVDFGSKPLCIIGHDKDESSYYLKKLNYHVEFIENINCISATYIRERYFLDNQFGDDSDFDLDENRISEPVYRYLVDFMESDTYKQLRLESLYYQDYKDNWKQWVKEPFFVTADMLIMDEENQILLIERGQLPGKGLLALPGGFVDANETTLEAAERELFEETGLKLILESFSFAPDDIEVKSGHAIGSITYKYPTYIADKPNRSLRGRILSHVFKRRIFGDLNRLNLKAGDDASKIVIKKLKDLKREEMFEDHYNIIMKDK